MRPKVTQKRLSAPQLHRTTRTPPITRMLAPIRHQPLHRLHHDLPTQHLLPQLWVQRLNHHLLIQRVLVDIAQHHVPEDIIRRHMHQLRMRRRIRNEVEKVLHAHRQEFPLRLWREALPKPFHRLIPLLRRHKRHVPMMRFTTPPFGFTPTLGFPVPPQLGIAKPLPTPSPLPTQPKPHNRIRTIQPILAINILYLRILCRHRSRTHRVPHRHHPLATLPRRRRRGIRVRVRLRLCVRVCTRTRTRARARTHAARVHVPPTRTPAGPRRYHQPLPPDRPLRPQHPQKLRQRTLLTLHLPLQLPQIDILPRQNLQTQARQPPRLHHRVLPTLPQQLPQYTITLCRNLRRRIQTLRQRAPVQRRKPGRRSLECPALGLGFRKRWRRVPQRRIQNCLP